MSFNRYKIQIPFHLIRSISFLIILIISFSANAQKERRYIRQGVDKYEKSLGDSGYVDTLRMQVAEAKFRDALDKNIDSYEAGFNLGTTLYKQKKYSEAIDQYKILAGKDIDKEELAQVFYNMGNSYLMDGKLNESIESYKNSLKKNPTDTAAKYNLAVAQKLLKEAENKQCDNPNNENQENQDKDEKKQDKEQQDKQNKESQEQENKEKKEEQEQQQANEEKDKGEEDKKKEMARPEEISKENAEKLLKANEQEEKELQKKLQKKKAKAKRIKIEKDW